MKTKKPERPKLTVNVLTVQYSQLITAEEVAFYLNQKVGTIYGYVRKASSKVKQPENPIPFRRAGRDLRFDIEEIIEWSRPSHQRREHV